MADQITFRLAGPEDYQAVLDINDNVYYGMDYIPAAYHDIINSRDTAMYLAVIKDKVVGLNKRWAAQV